MKNDYDVIVVGAGPAGSIAARAATKECDVLLIEKRQEIGSPVRCAEGVPLIQTSNAFHFYTSFAKLVTPDPAWISREINAARMIAPDGTTVDLTAELLRMEEPLGYVLERKIFDRALAKNAARAGADVSVRTRATGLIMEDGAVTGAKMNRLGEDFEVRSRVVIGADGVESQVGRWGGLNTTLAPADIESSVQYHVDNLGALDPTLEMHFGSRYAPGGYAWVFPKGEHAANVGLGVLGSKIKNKRPIEYLNEFMADNFPDGQPVGLVMGGVPVSEGLRTMTREGLMLVGDAARHTEPVTGGGILAALESGLIAGKVACEAVHRNDASMTVLRQYEAEWNSTPYGRQRKRMYKMKDFIVHRSDEELNRMMRVMHGITTREMTMKGMFLRIVRNDPKLFFLMRHLI
jgi:digeranylgeranylglycerophospholipid reductase